MSLWSCTARGGYDDWLDRVRALGDEDGAMGVAGGVEERGDGLMPGDAFVVETGWLGVGWGVGAVVPGTG